MITDREKGLTHVYTKLAGMTTDERRRVMLRFAGCYSSKQLDQERFERIMAVFEHVLWTRVSRGQAPDPRCCTVCGRPLKPVGHGKGACPEGCQTRKVYAWAPRHWRRRLPAKNQANTRLLWKLKRYWQLLREFLPEEKRNDHYLAGIICKSGPQRPCAAVAKDLSSQVAKLISRSGSLRFDSLTPEQARRSIEALKDRMHNAVKES